MLKKLNEGSLAFGGKFIPW